MFSDRLFFVDFHEWLMCSLTQGFVSYHISVYWKKSRDEIGFFSEMNLGALLEDIPGNGGSHPSHHACIIKLRCQIVKSSFLVLLYFNIEII